MASPNFYGGMGLSERSEPSAIQLVGVPMVMAMVSSVFPYKEASDFIHCLGESTRQ